MPVNSYFGGHGEQVMGNMTKEYGPNKGKRVFYATANKKGIKPAFGGDVAGYGGVQDPEQDPDSPMPTIPPRQPIQLSSYDAPSADTQGAVPSMPSMPGLMASNMAPPSPPPSSGPSSGPGPDPAGPMPEISPNTVLSTGEGPMPMDPRTAAAVSGSEENPPAPPRAGFGEGENAKALQKALQEYSAIAGKKVPWWQTAIGMALSASRGRDIAPMLMQPRGLSQAERKVSVLAKGAEEERKQQANASAERLKEEQIGLTNEQKKAVIAQKQASLKPVPTIANKLSEALDANRVYKEKTGDELFTDDDYRVLASGGHVSAEKASKLLSVAPDHTLFDPTTNKSVFTAPSAPAKPGKEVQDPNHWIAIRNDPRSTPEQVALANQNIKDWESTQKNQRQPININWTPQQAAAAAIPLADGERNEEFLKQFSAQDQYIIKMLADYDYQLPKGRGALEKNGKYIAAAKAYDRSFNAAEYENRQKSKQFYGTGLGGQNITALNTALVHLGGLNQSISTLDNSAFRPYNTFSNWLTTNVGNPQVKPFMNYRTAFAEEMARALKGGVATKEEVAQWQHNIDSSDSPASLKSSIRDVSHIIAGRIGEQEANYTRVFEKGPKVPFLSPSAKSTLDQLGGVKPAPTGPQAALPSSSLADDFARRKGIIK